MNPKAENIVRRLTEAGFTAFYAGGSVRDMLLDRIAKDIDIATNALPEQVQELFPRVTDIQGKVFGVVRVIENDEMFEVATFRKDGVYEDGRRPANVTFSSPLEDAQRRDFTINGLFYDPIKKEVIDFVNGKQDLQNKLIRAIGSAKKRFEEDHLRIFRAIRFAAELNFEIEPETWAALCSMAQLTQDLAPERVRDELNKCFTGSNPQRAFDLLDSSKLLKLWLPEVTDQKNVEQPPDFHPEGDVFTHVRIMVGMLQNPSLELAWSVLLHDIGKPHTYKVDPHGRIRFNEHETVGARMAEKILRRLRFANDQIDNICAIIAAHMSFKDVPNMRLSTLKRFLSRPTIHDDIALHRIDCLGCHGDLSIYNAVIQKWDELSKEPIKPPPFIRGEDVLALGIPSGPAVGKILTTLEDEQLEGKLTSREQALLRLKDFCEATSNLN